MPLLKVHDIACRYDREPVFENLSFHANQGEITGLLGASGCGKTTALRAVAGFEPLLAGEIHIKDQLVASPAHSLPPEQRNIGMVFQDYALFPHLTVVDNVAFGLRGRERRSNRIAAERMLERVGMAGLGERYPHELSGGQQQRVALARALAPHPDLLLMDEPFSNLDVELRERLNLEVRDILRAEGITGILVTHDQQEAFAICDKVAVMHEGRILQCDTPYNLYHEPADRVIADFIGQGAFLPGQALSPDRFDTELGELQANRAYPHTAGQAVDILLRPDDLVPDELSPVRARVVERAFKGAGILYTLALPSGRRLLSLFPGRCDHPHGTEVGVRVQADHLICFPSRGD